MHTDLCMIIKMRAASPR